MSKSKRIAKQAATESTTETSKTSLRIEIDATLRERFRSFNLQERQQIGLTINQAVAAWGHPHLHAGVGIRKMTHSYFECRSGLHTRLVFKVLGSEALHFVFMGNHDEIRRFIKSSR